MRQRYVYFLKPVGQAGPVKIGTTDQPEARLHLYSSWSPVPLEIAAMLPGDYKLERRFHTYFQANRLHHEWFAASDALLQAIADIKAGTFDTASLPTKTPLPDTPKVREHRRWLSVIGRLRRLEKRGVSVPDHVQRATSHWKAAADERVRLRLVVADWVEAQRQPSDRQAA